MKNPCSRLLTATLVLNMIVNTVAQILCQIYQLLYQHDIKIRLVCEVGPIIGWSQDVMLKGLRTKLKN